MPYVHAADDRRASTEFRILGPFEVVVDGRTVEIGGSKPRGLLAALLLRANEVVSQDELIDALWEAAPPATAAKTLQAYVSRLRRALAGERGDAAASGLETHGHGYVLRVSLDEVDALRFESMLGEARSAHAAGNPELAADVLRRALSLWRGPPLADVAYASFAQPEIARLEELRLSALEERIEADLARGRHGEIVGELEALVARHPLRERLRGQLMLALYRAGRQAKALAVYQDGRRVLAEELGLEPSAQLRWLERGILQHDPSLAGEPSSRAELASTRLPARPRHATSFVGRRRELRELSQLLARSDVRLLTLTGPPGTGKTRLAYEAAAHAAEKLAEPASLVELAAVPDAGLVPETIAHALGVAIAPGRRALDAVVSHLAYRSALLVLDNFEHVLPAAPAVVELLAGTAGSKVLVTSRAPLDVADEVVYPVAALAIPGPSERGQTARLGRIDAVRLFVERARGARPDFALTAQNADAVAELCARLDGLPLALELAAARVKLLSPNAILERLAGRLELLRAEPGSGVPERHRTLNAAIGWSYDLLRPDEQALFASLSVFAGGFTVEGAEAVSAPGEGRDVVAGLESLLANNLVRVAPMAAGEPRFGMLATIHEYALARLAERRDRDAIRRRHAELYLRLAEAAEAGLIGRDQEAWLERLDAERENFRAALAWSTATGDAELGLRIAASLWRFWQLRGADAEGREWLERQLAGRAGARATRARARLRLSSLVFVQGDHEAAQRHVEASLPVLRQRGDERLVVDGLHLLAMSALALGDGARALALSEEALDVAVRARDAGAESYSLFNLGVVLAAAGELDEAWRAVDESVRRARRLGNVRSVANWLRALGGLAFRRGDRPQARTLLEQSLAMHRRLNDPWGVSHALSGLALIALEDCDHAAARQLLAESVGIERESGDRPGLLRNVEVAARLAAAERRHVVAARLYGCASALGESLRPHPTELVIDDTRHQRELRAALGERAFAEAWADGRTLTLEDALAHALEDDAGSVSDALSATGEA